MDVASESRGPQGASWWTSGAGAFLLWSLVFGVSYTQAPLYYSNQTQYFLHGLASAGDGYLDQDWLANTKDPTPVFSALVACTYRLLDEHLFHVYYILIFGCYFASLVGVFTFLSDRPTNSLTKLSFMTGLVVLHAGLTRLASTRLTGVDYPWYFQAGVAGQYVLGFGLQPSVFGVFLLTSIVAYLRGRRWSAIAWACLAGIVHGTYLLGAAMLVISYMALEWRTGHRKEAFLQGLAALALVSPAVTYNLVTFAPASVQEFADAQQILAHFRIPHHAEPERWFDSIAAGQVAWILFSLVLLRRGPLFVIMAIVVVLSLALTMLQIATGSDSLALLFPWRTSAILVPLATAIILAKITYGCDSWLTGRTSGLRLAIQIGCTALLIVCVAGGVFIYIFEWGYAVNQSEIPLLRHVKSNRRSGETYLLPVAIPKIGAGPKGAASTNFTPPPRAGKSGHLIAVDLQRFRLYTGTPIYVDFKSIPYKDVEVLEWRRRLDWAATLYADRAWTKDDVVQALAEHGMTHVVVTADRDIQDWDRNRVYADETYRVYRVPNSAFTK